MNIIMNKYINRYFTFFIILNVDECLKYEYGVLMTSNGRDISITFSFSLASDRWRWWIEFCISIKIFRISMIELQIMINLISSSFEHSMFLVSHSTRIYTHKTITADHKNYIITLIKKREEKITHMNKRQ